MFDPSDNLLATELQQVVIVYPAALAQPEKNQLMTALEIAELFGEIACRTFDVTLNVAGVSKAPLADERVRTEPEAVILEAPPVAQIVTRHLARAREVADLVLRETGGGETLHHLDVEIGDQLFIGDAHHSAFDAAAQRRVFVEIEHVDGDVADAAGNRLAERFAE